ncbi:flagellar hook-associated protein FlgK [Parahaliea mediterranea]|uniref:flagellar hook-associated protein FlgK n=1 Tax=Parahaliea mediterranea TaxID=651086 RepID=UPI000E2EF96A|nr:flagellar hook-associated protein FlgK [Parahaliea mediterranea]
MSIFSIGLSGLNAAQNALNTTSNNISNVYTPGYNRELTILGESKAGDGVKVNDIQRQFNAYVTEQLNAASSRASALQTYETQVSQIDNLLADSESGLSLLLQNFFASIGDLVNAPSDPAARQGVIGTAEALSAQFRSFDGYLDDMRSGVDGQIRDEVKAINNTASQVAWLNREIALAKARTGEAPNSLLNQRDQLVAELSERVDVRLDVSETGSYSLSVANGRPLVAGVQSYELTTQSASADPTRTVVGYIDAAGNTVELGEDALAGGSLGGLLQFRSESLDAVQNRLGQLAVSLAAGFNAQHSAGVDLNGDPGADFFAMGEPTLFSNTRNSGSASLDVAYGDISQLTASDYELTVADAAAGTFNVKRLDSGETLTLTLDGANQLTIGGVVVTVDDPALLADGDRFSLQPVRGGAGDFDALISDSSDIAAGLGAGSGDNENALALQQLQNEALVAGGATLNQAYAALVGDVGNRTNIVQVNLSAQQGLSEQLRAVQQSESGVNLDEEAANLIRYQQYYQANAKVIETATVVIDALLGLR